ncbi:biotin operon repressor [Deinococcus metalli]|uniref:Biotin operon repressor n=1 Tax=Deinococcus metalli TaxID=1141878 RepID=A0A7W8KFP0_9DEIO|nr:DUF2087 domain-containing protein [Deinococcus metalli]MBB5376156.1 biotin operon repressor [Deinococcus metalli]GHF40375.1 hypothetical protein GCM10017781_16250 [Deinococcus metalli]
MSDDLNARAAVFRALSHPARLSLLRLTWHEPLSGEELARLMNLAPATVSHHLSQLVEVGLMTARQHGHARLHGPDHAALDATLAGLVRGTTPTLPSADPYRERVLRSFFQGGRLTTIPAQLKKKVVVMHELGQRFEPGRMYPEREVNAILGGVHPDVSTLRREMVGIGVLARERGVYWRVTPDGTDSPGTADAAGAGPLE